MLPAETSLKETIRGRLRPNADTRRLTVEWVCSMRIRSEQITEFKDKKNLMTKMMVQNLSSRTTVESLNRLFSEFGAVRSVSLATDIMTGRCGGFGFVHLDEQQTGTALSALNGRYLGDRVLHVTYEQKRDYKGVPIQRNKDR